MARLARLIAPFLLLTALTPASAAEEPICEELIIPLSDGIRLYGTVARNAPDGPRPVWLTVSTYSSTPCAKHEDSAYNALDRIGKRNAEQMAIVRVSMRGTGASEGLFDSWGPRSQHDMQEVVDFVTRQPWYGGRITAGGVSGDGLTVGWLLEHPRVDAGVFLSSCPSLYRNCVRRGGVYSGVLEVNTAGTYGSVQAGLEPKLRHGLTQTNPVQQAIALRSGYNEPALHDANDAWWRDRNGGRKAPWGGKPVYYATDTYDIIPGALDNAVFQRYEYLNLGMGHPAMVKQAVNYQTGLPIGRYDELVARPLERFVERYALGKRNGAERDARVVVMSNLGSYAGFERGDVLVRSEPSYPLPATRWQELLLSSSPDGAAASLNDGALVVDAGPDGQDVAPVVSSQQPKPDVRVQYSTPSGAFVDDFRVEEAGALTYTTPPLKRAVELTGPLTVRLFASASMSDFDWAIRVTDVWPSGQSHWQGDGFLRASLREVDRNRSMRDRNGRIVAVWQPMDRRVPVPAGEVLEYVIGIVPMSNVFQAGHRLRLDIQAVAGGMVDSATTRGLGIVTVHHGPSHPSGIMLPVIADRCAASVPLRADGPVVRDCVEDLADAM